MSRGMKKQSGLAQRRTRWARSGGDSAFGAHRVSGAGVAVRAGDAAGKSGWGEGSREGAQPTCDFERRANSSVRASGVAATSQCAREERADAVMMTRSCFPLVSWANYVAYDSQQNCVICAVFDGWEGLALSQCVRGADAPLSVTHPFVIIRA